MRDSVHFMVDIETLGVNSNAPILSIGCVMFSKDNPNINSYYCNVELSSCIEAGMKIDSDTFYWWISQEDAARKSLLQNRIDIKHALLGLYYFISKEDDFYVWSKSTNFDFRILESAYNLLCLPVAWNYRVVLDVRTVFKIYDIHQTASHNALEDCIIQAEMIQKVLQCL